MSDELGKGRKTRERARAAAQELNDISRAQGDCYPGLPADYLPGRLEDLRRRGDIVRKYREVASELRQSLLNDMRSGRRRSAVIHFRSFADWCLGALFVAYPATRGELDRRSLPNDLAEKLDRIAAHWERPISPDELKKLRALVHDSSQAVHGSRKAAEAIDRWAANWAGGIEGACGLLMEGVEEADRCLNSHRKQTSRPG
jgi:hypothetical protein